MVGWVADGVGYGGEVHCCWCCCLNYWWDHGLSSRVASQLFHIRYGISVKYRVIQDKCMLYIVISSIYVYFWYEFG